MTCKEAVARITDFYEGVLSSSEAQEIQSHLANCENCHTYFQNRRHLDDVLRNLPDPAPLSANAKPELMEAFQKQQRRR